MAAGVKTSGEFIFQNKNVARKIKSFSWLPNTDVKALAFIVHGYGERLTPYYDSLCEAGMREGVHCFGHDHVGHGESEGERVQVDSESEYVTPVLDHCRKIKEQYPSKPLYLVGHSMGGLIAVCTALEDGKQEDPMVAGLVLVGPLIEPDPTVATPLKRFLARMLSNVLPGFMLGEIAKSGLTSDKDWIEIIEKDKLRWHGKFKARHSHVLLNKMEELKSEMENIKIPLFILHGEKDTICAISGSRLLYESVTSSDKSLKVVKEGLHNILLEREPIRSETYSDIWTWVLSRAIQYLDLGS
ncbi:monoglyceride lipase [Eurytemora carolleeae]|uniref:monoglyceride lipase n=1 Tax=Eurytemora carolleeae TaxID=1294199 RepID=UPI000C78CB0C|nr:monoglyceride lipase [Eurytemora carolleeae]|eukprot:XP_023347775.1 monoglyceride lipase-like [Eurytemora affinis]